ncbi:MAG: tetratricopeptide repeat protein [Bradymonadia bacterium]
MAINTKTRAWFIAGLGAIIAAVTAISMTPDMAATQVTKPEPPTQAPIRYFDSIPTSVAQIPSHATQVSKADETCADCHPDAVEAYEKTGMGRSLYRVQSASIIENFDPQAATVTHEATGLIYRAYRDSDGRWWQEEALPKAGYERRVEALYVIGSGNNTRSYLGLVEGLLVELPLTWYVGRKLWDMSPGYDKTNKRFERVVNAKCLFCHNDLTPEKRGREGQFTTALAEGISCNRCHGDGSQHASNRLKGITPAEGQPSDIINPKRLTGEQQNQLCGQCHLQGLARILASGEAWDRYDPSQALTDYVDIFVHEVNDGPEFGIASHGIRLQESACAKIGKATCIHCHNPHARDVKLSTQTACESCHKPGATVCAEAHSSQGTCASCHMPRGETSDIPHVNFTDHFIRKRPEAYKNSLTDKSAKIANAFGTGDQSEPNLAEALAHYNAWKMGSDDYGEAHKSKASAALNSLIADGIKEARGLAALGHLALDAGQGQKAIEHLMDASRTAPEDADLHLRLGLAQQSVGQLTEAVSTLTRLLKAHPQHRAAWVNLGGILAELGNHEKADAAYARADQINPEFPLTALNRGRNAAAQKRMQTARKWYKESIRRDPLLMLGHLSLALLDFDLRRFSTARKTLNQALVIKTDYAAGYWLLGRIDLEQGEIESAEKNFETFRRLQPSEPHPYLELAALYGQTKRVSKAIQTLKDAKAKLGNLPQLNQMLRRLHSMPKQQQIYQDNFSIQ